MVRRTPLERTLIDKSEEVLESGQKERSENLVRPKPRDQVANAFGSQVRDGLCRREYNGLFSASKNMSLFSSINSH